MPGSTYEGTGLGMGLHRRENSPGGLCQCAEL